jgi:tetratricopeptide (TPR) repeat protein
MIFLALALCFASPRLRYEEELETKVMIRISEELEQGNHREAQKLLEAFDTELFPSDRMYYNAGLFYNQQGDLARAKKYYDRAIEINGAQSSALYDRAELLLLEGRLSEAKQDLQVLIAQEQEHWAIYFRMAEISAKEGDGLQMEKYLLDAIKRDLELEILVQDFGTWSAIAKDPQLNPYLHRIFMVMAEENLWEGLLSE